MWLHGVDFERNKFNAQQLQRTEAWLLQAVQKKQSKNCCEVYAAAIMGLIQQPEPLIKPEDLPETLVMDLSRFQMAQTEFVCLADRAAVFALATCGASMLNITAKAKNEVLLSGLYMVDIAW